MKRFYTQKHATIRSTKPHAAQPAMQLRMLRLAKLPCCCELVSNVAIKTILIHDYNYMLHNKIFTIKPKQYLKSYRQSDITFLMLSYYGINAIHSNVVILSTPRCSLQMSLCKHLATIPQIYFIILQHYLPH